jgi:hypothetical protein
LKDLSSKGSNTPSLTRTVSIGRVPAMNLILGVMMVTLAMKSFLLLSRSVPYQLFLQQQQQQPV